MKIININPHCFIVKGDGWKQYYIKGKCLQITKKHKYLIDTSKMKEIRRIDLNG